MRRVRQRERVRVYTVDTGLEYAVSSRRVQNDGARFETLVFLALRRQFWDISYFDDGGECDFVVRDRHAVVAAVQACTYVTDEDLERERDGLLAAMERFDLPKGTIVTIDQRDTLVVDGRTIDVVPFWDWQMS